MQTEHGSVVFFSFPFIINLRQRGVGGSKKERKEERGGSREEGGRERKIDGNR